MGEPVAAVDPLDDFRHELGRFAETLDPQRREVLQLRFLAGLTQMEAAARLGMPRSTLEDWEREIKRRLEAYLLGSAAKRPPRRSTGGGMKMSWGALRGHGLVEGHFAGANGTRSDRRMWRHLRRCETCRVRYRTHALCEAIQSDGEQRARERLGRAAFAPRPRALPLVTLAALAAGAALLLLVPRLQQRSGFHESSGFHARSGLQGSAGVAEGPAITLYRVAPPAPPERAGAVVRAGDALAFSYSNPPEQAFTHLMIFAHDDAGRVFWYWPAWHDPASNPGAIAIAPARSAVELGRGEAVKHRLSPGGLTLTALFSNRVHDVRTVEAALAQGETGLAALEGQLVHERVEVLP